MKKLLFAMAIGAALAWLFDPDAGSRRRDALKRKLDEKGLTGPAAVAAVRPTLGDGLHAAVRRLHPLIRQEPNVSTTHLSGVTGHRHRRLVRSSGPRARRRTTSPRPPPTAHRPRSPPPWPSAAVEQLEDLPERVAGLASAAKGRIGPTPSAPTSRGCSSPPGSRRSSSSPGGCAAGRRAAPASTTRATTGDTYRSAAETTGLRRRQLTDGLRPTDPSDTDPVATPPGGGAASWSRRRGRIGAAGSADVSVERRRRSSSPPWLRICSKLRRSRRDTCIWEMPMRSAISLWLSSS